MAATTYSSEYKDCLTYIENYWDLVTHQPTRKEVQHHTITIPYAYITPNHKKFDFIFYWDTFFMFRGLMGTKRSWVMKEMINNFAYLFETQGIIPNFNAHAAMGRSQPPFFTQMILDAYFSLVPYHTHQTLIRKQLHNVHYFQEKRWLEKMISTAKKEYFTVWIDPDNFYNHSVKNHLLSRYGDRDVGYAHSSELESGWDFTSRFYNRCSDFLPVDLNSLLYKYERDFADAARILGNADDERFWTMRSEERKAEINRLMWDEKSGFFYDYGYQFERQSDFLSLAGFVPLWAGLATKNQAEKSAKMLKKFTSPFGLTITAKESLAQPIDLSKIQKRYHPAIKEIIEPKQWDYPNIWAPLEYLTVIGLLRYGLVNEAKDVMKLSIRAQAAVFRRHGTFLEKIDGTTGEGTGEYHYENQPGFGWTNGVFYRFVKILDHLESSEENYLEREGEPPFTLNFLH